MKKNKKPLICIPLGSKNKEDLIKEIDYCLSQEPDLLEWRVDYYKDYDNIQELINILSYIKSKNNQIPIIFTLRSFLEGGYREIEDKHRLDIIKEIIKTNLIEMVDIEIYLGGKIQEIRLLAQDHNVSLVLSYHNFKETPKEEDIIKKFKEGIDLKGDILKVAVMAKTTEDILNLFSARFKIMKETTKPIILIGMGEIGRVTRINSEFFSSHIVYASGLKSTGPGQVHINELRRRQ